MAIYYLLDVGHAAVAELYGVPDENFPFFVVCVCDGGCCGGGSISTVEPRYFEVPREMEKSLK